jgi:hypothetical protein
MQPRLSVPEPKQLLVEKGGRESCEKERLRLAHGRTGTLSAPWLSCCHESARRLHSLPGGCLVCAHLHTSDANSYPALCETERALGYQGSRVHCHLSAS